MSKKERKFVVRLNENRTLLLKGKKQEYDFENMRVRYKKKLDYAYEGIGKWKK